MLRLARAAQQLALHGAAVHPARHHAAALRAHQQLHALTRRGFADSAELRARRLAAAAQRAAKAAEAHARAGGSEGGGQLQPLAPDSSVRAASDTPSDVAVAAVLDHPALVVTRAIEWGTVILGFEQATKYTVYDHHGTVVALMAEERTGVANEVARQLLRTHRSFTTTVFTADGSQEVFRVRRPAYLLNSYMYIEDPQGQPIGEVRQRWHPWQRNYDVFIGRRQFAAINSPLLAWEFEMKDETGGTLALIDRNFLGFAREIFTDAGQYAIHFGFKPSEAASIQQQTLVARSGQQDVKVEPLAQAAASDQLAVIPSMTGKQLAVVRPLTLDERMIALATAISVDYNYFSRHSNSSGMFTPPLFMPLPIPMPGGGGGGGAAAGAEAAGGAAGGGAAAAGAEAAGAGGAEGVGAAASGGGAAGAGEVEGGAWGDAGFQAYEGGDGGQASGGWGDDAETFKWDAGGEAGGGLGGLGGSGGGEGGEEGGIASVLRFLWGLIGGGDD